jgi:hypothetical protein
MGKRRKGKLLQTPPDVDGGTRMNLRIQELPADVLQCILTLVVTSPEAPGWSKLLRTCKVFKEVLLQPAVIRSTMLAKYTSLHKALWAVFEAKQSTIEDRHSHYLDIMDALAAGIDWKMLPVVERELSGLESMEFPKISGERIALDILSLGSQLLGSVLLPGMMETRLEQFMEVTASKRNSTQSKDQSAYAR